MTTTKTALLERIRASWNTAMVELNRRRLTEAESESVSRLEVYENVERLFPAQDELTNLGSWAFNQAVDRLATTQSKQKNMLVLIQQVTIELFDEMMKSNLSHNSWAEEEVIWSNTPIREIDLN